MKFPRHLRSTKERLNFHLILFASKSSKDSWPPSEPCNCKSYRPVFTAHGKSGNSSSITQSNASQFSDILSSIIRLKWALTEMPLFVLQPDLDALFFFQVPLFYVLSPSLPLFFHLHLPLSLLLPCPPLLQCSREIWPSLWYLFFSSVDQPPLPSFISPVQFAKILSALWSLIVSWVSLV